MVADTDSPPDWLSRGLGIEEIVGLRAGTIRGSGKIIPFLPKIQEIAISPAPIEIEASFERPIRFDLAFDGTMAPVGLTGVLSSLEVIGHSSVERPVDRVCSDSDLLAEEACEYLHRSGIDVYRISRLFSAALVGRQRRVVPTRWSITAVDDMLGKGLIRNLSGEPVNAVRLCFSELFANRFAIFLFPGPWEFEMVEMWAAHSLWAGDGESVTVDGERGKKSVYSPISGAYYAARLAVAEYLERSGVTARVLVVRFVTPDYWAPLGVWVVREAVRQAMKSTPLTFPGAQEAVEKASCILGTASWIPRSRLLSKVKAQRTLDGFV